MRPPRNFGQQAARASWIAPIVALTVGVLTGVTRSEDRTASIVIGAINLLILVAGGVFAIVALLGMRRWGRQGVLAPAVVGLVLFAFFGFSVVGTLSAVRRAKMAQQQAQQTQQAREADLRQVRNEGEEAFFRPGWFGVAEHAGGTVALTGMPDDVSFIAEMLASLDAPVSVLAVGIDNSRGAQPITVDPSGAVIHFADGTSTPAPDVYEVLQSIKSPEDRAAGTRMFGPPFQAQPGAQLVGKVMFLPKGADAQAIDRIFLQVNGQPFDVHGRFYTEQEKRELHRVSQEQQKADGSH